MKRAFEENISRICRQDHTLFFFEETDSTNRRAIEHIKSGLALGGEVFIAKKQIGGKGTRGRSFFSEGGLYMSVILRTGKGSKNVTQSAAVCVCRAIDSLFGTKCSIKWVNDVKLCGKKLCGILCEGCIRPGENKPEFTVVGIGINTNIKEFPKEIADIATSLYLYTHKGTDDSLLAAHILSEIDRCEADIRTEYKERCETLGKDVEIVSIDGSLKRGTAIDIDIDGALILKCEHGDERIIHGDVFII